ncbi:MAG: FkbM family methyltransferase [Cognaticolwellia sp.]|jgi:FkbM family methyltransferase
MNFKTAIKTPFSQLRKKLLSNNFFGLMYYYQYIWQPKPNSLAAILDGFSKKNKNTFFVQVGGNDGFQNDLICKFVKRHRWEGITIEPQVKPFQSLTEIYKKDKVTPVNAAIDSENKTRKLYKIAFTDARWASGLSSFLRSHLEEKIKDGYIEKKAKKTGISLPKDKSDWIGSEKINCLTFETIFKKYAVQKIDILQIDTEGFDYEILKLFQFNTFLPKIIIFESENLSDSDLAECKVWLHSKGYDFQTFGGDTLGVLK